MLVLFCADFKRRASRVVPGTQGHSAKWKRFASIMPANSPSPKKQILVIDDDPSIHDLVGYALRSEPVDITACETAAEGLKRVKEASSTSFCWT